MDDDEVTDEYEIEAASALPSVRWTWLVLGLRVVETVRNILRAVAGGLDMVATDIAQHYNYRYDQQAFADEARADIERITASVEPDDEGA